MKIFIVSEAGKIADVTLHTSCKSADESALKVTIKTLMSKIVLDQTYVQTVLPQGGGRGMNAQLANSIVSCWVAWLLASQQFLRSPPPAPPSTLTARKHEGP